MSRVTVEVERIENVFHHVSLLVLQNMVSKDPWEGHLDRELGDQEAFIYYTCLEDGGMCTCILSPMVSSRKNSLNQS